MNDIEIYDTTGHGGKDSPPSQKALDPHRTAPASPQGEEWVVVIVRDVPAETVGEACRMVAEKKGYRWIGTVGDPNHFYAIDFEYYRQWNMPSSDLERDLGKDIKFLRKMGEARFHGLLRLSEHHPAVEERWELDG